MRRARAFFLAVCVLGADVAARPAAAVEAPFDDGLLRLSEVLGSLHFLRNLCGEKGYKWRFYMQKLLTAENPSPERRARFIASFNRGYRTFEATYSSCTTSASEAMQRYMTEGERLSRDIVVRYGN